MKKYGILNSNIAKLADDLGHMDLVCIRSEERRVGKECDTGC